MSDENIPEHTNHTPREIMSNYLLSINLLEQTLQGNEDKIFHEMKQAGVTDKDLVEGLMVLSFALIQNVSSGSRVPALSILNILREKALKSQS